MIDLHSHILPGLDDGVRTLDEARALASAAARDGVRRIAATPHVRSDFPTRADEMEAALGDVRADVQRHGLPVDVVAGGEVALDYLDALDAAELLRFTLAQTGRYLLLEFPYVGWPLAVEQQLADLRGRGVVALLAHPERNPDVQENPSLIEALVAAGALVQVTAASLEGRLGKRSKRTAAALIDAGCVHVLATDAHAPGFRDTGLQAAARTLKDPGLARHLTQDVPAAILAGEPVPQRLSRARRW